MKKHPKRKDEEFSAEIINPVPLRRKGKNFAGGEEKAGLSRNRTLGWIAVIVALASLFYWPAVLGPAGAVIGFIAFLRGNRALGIWSIVLGLLALVVFLFLFPH